MVGHIIPAVWFLTLLLQWNQDKAGIYTSDRFWEKAGFPFFNSLHEIQVKIFPMKTRNCLRSTDHNDTKKACVGSKLTCCILAFSKLFLDHWVCIISLWFPFQMEFAVYPSLNPGITTSYKLNYFCNKLQTLCLVTTSECHILWHFRKLMTVYFSGGVCEDYTLFMLFHLLNFPPLLICLKLIQTNLEIKLQPVSPGFWQQK